MNSRYRRCRPYPHSSCKRRTRHNNYPRRRHNRSIHRNRCRSGHRRSSYTSRCIPDKAPCILRIPRNSRRKSRPHSRCIGRIHSSSYLHRLHNRNRCRIRRKHRRPHSFRIFHRSRRRQGYIPSIRYRRRIQLQHSFCIADIPDSNLLHRPHSRNRSCR